MIASYIVKATYHNLIDASYRTESELAILTENITHAKSLKIEYEGLIDKAEQLKNLENNIDDAEKTLEKIEELNKEIEDNEDFLSNNLTESTKYLDDIRKQNLNAEKLVLTMKDHESIIEDKIKAIEVDADTVVNQKEQFDKLLITSKKMFDEQQEEIQKIIEDANRASMAGSFNARKKGITRSIWFLDGCTVVFLGAIVLLLWNIFTSSYNQDIFSPSLFFSRIPITLPLIWLAWLASRKSAYLTRIKEDYAYKYSSAMAFEGYKKQVQEISPDLQEKLLDIAVTNLGENPTRLYNGKIKHTPIDLEALLDLIKSLPTEKMNELLKLITNLKK